MKFQKNRVSNLEYTVVYLTIIILTIYTIHKYAYFLINNLSRGLHYLLLNKKS